MPITCKVVEGQLEYKLGDGAPEQRLPYIGQEPDRGFLTEDGMIEAIMEAIKKAGQDVREEQHRLSSGAGEAASRQRLAAKAGGLQAQGARLMAYIAANNPLREDGAGRAQHPPAEARRTATAYPRTSGEEGTADDTAADTAADTADAEMPATSDEDEEAHEGGDAAAAKPVVATKPDAFASWCRRTPGVEPWMANYYDPTRPGAAVFTPKKEYGPVGDSGHVLRHSTTSHTEPEGAAGGGGARITPTRQPATEHSPAGAITSYLIDPAIVAAGQGKELKAACVAAMIDWADTAEGGANVADRNAPCKWDAQCDDSAQQKLLQAAIKPAAAELVVAEARNHARPQEGGARAPQGNPTAAARIAMKALMAEAVTEAAARRAKGGEQLTQEAVKQAALEIVEAAVAAVGASQGAAITMGQVWLQFNAGARDGMCRAAIEAQCADLPPRGPDGRRADAPEAGGSADVGADTGAADDAEHNHADGDDDDADYDDYDDAADDDEQHGGASPHPDSSDAARRGAAEAAKDQVQRDEALARSLAKDGTGDEVKPNPGAADTAALAEQQQEEQQVLADAEASKADEARLAAGLAASLADGASGGGGAEVAEADGAVGPGAAGEPRSGFEALEEGIGRLEAALEAGEGASERADVNPKAGTEAATGGGEEELQDGATASGGLEAAEGAAASRPHLDDGELLAAAFDGPGSGADGGGEPGGGLMEDVLASGEQQAVAARAAGQDSAGEPAAPPTNGSAAALGAGGAEMNGAAAPRSPFSPPAAGVRAIVEGDGTESDASSDATVSVDGSPGL